jgi:flagellar biosynthesis chaperone FliJ
MTTLETIKQTVKSTLEYSSVSEIIQYIEAERPKWVEKPSKPNLKSNATSKEIREYADLVETFETRLAKYEADKKNYNILNQEINSYLEEFITEQSGLNKIPEKSRTKVWDLAWDKKRDEGYYYVYSFLEELVDLFN